MTTHIIDRLGHLGDGIATDGSYLPFTLPGERVDAGPPLRILTSAPDRTTPPCPHFGTCGGCALQHASDSFLAGWKIDVVHRALAAQGLAAPLHLAHVSPPATRRRAVLAGRRTRKGVQIGFHARGSDAIVETPACKIVLPRMLAAWPALEAVTRAGASRNAQLRLALTATDTGFDLDVGSGKPLDPALRQTLAGIATEHDLARLSWTGETVAQLRAPVLRIGAAQVTPPPGAFLQATAEAEAALVAAVRNIVRDAAEIVDLFAGCGTFALPLAENAQVHAAEGDAAMVAALDAGWRGAPGLKAVRAEVRDLFRRPLEPLDLKRFDAAVIDPPRAGAQAQSARLAAATIPVVAAVSCNPVSFARDAAALVAGGLRLVDVAVIDQFRWSPHVELVGCFRR